MKLLNRFFGAPEEINGGNRCPTYLYRWHVVSTRWFKAYVHHFVDDDWCLDLHDHPRRFISIGLKGGYIEVTPDSHIVGLGEKMTIFNAPWFRTFPAEHIHRLRMFRWGGENGVPIKIFDCWTFVVVILPSSREWGFWNKGRFIDWRTYVKGSKSHLAEERKACQ